MKTTEQFEQWRQDFWETRDRITSNAASAMTLKELERVDKKASDAASVRGATIGSQNVATLAGQVCLMKLLQPRSPT